MLSTIIRRQSPSSIRLAQDQYRRYGTKADDSSQRPDLLAPAMTVTVSQDNHPNNDYVFFTPYQEDQAGPYIYDKEGVC